MSIEKRRAGYTVRWRDSTGVQCSKHVTLWRDAIALDGEMKRKKAMGELVAHEKGKIMLEDFWEVWWLNYALPQLTSRTRAVYGRLWSTHVIRALGPRSKVKEISREDVAAAVSTWSRSLAPSSVRKVSAVLQGVLERAVEWGYIPTNPAKGVRRPKLVQRRGRVITQEELEALCLELGPRSATIVRVLAYTGIRPGELRGLQWGDWRPASLRPVARICIERAVSNNELKLPKTGRPRVVPLNAAAQRVLRERWVAQGQPGGTDYVFPGRDGKVWTDYGWNSWQQDVFKPAAARAGLKGLVPYDLRHTCISAMIAAGMDPVRVARIAGHSPTMALTTYAQEFESVYSERDSGLDTWEIPSAGGRRRAAP